MLIEYILYSMLIEVYLNYLSITMYEHICTVENEQFYHCLKSTMSLVIINFFFGVKEIRGASMLVKLDGTMAVAYVK